MNVKNSAKKHWNLFKQSATGWSDDRAMTLSAATAYYTIFSLAPLLIIAVAVAGLVFGQEASSGEIFSSIRGLIGDQGAKTVQDMVQASSVKDKGVVATIIGFGTLIVGATTVFGQLQESLNQIWKVMPSPGRGLWRALRQRLLSFSLILVIGFLLLVSLLVTAALSAVGKFAESHLPGGEAIWQVINLLVSFGVMSALFAAMYKILPDVKLAWRETWVGAAITALLFSIGKFLIGLYLGRSSVTSTFGAAGSGVVILIWSYYSTAILYFGAEYTKFHALAKQRPIPLKEGAQWIEGKTPLQKEPSSQAGPREAAGKSFGRPAYT